MVEKNNQNLDSANIPDEDSQDFDLIRKFIDGKESAFEQLINKHKEKVRNIIYLTLGDSDLIDDISQDVFINVYHNLKVFRFESKFTTWLYRIAVNKCRDYLRKKKVRNIFVPLKHEHDPGISTHNENLDIPRLVRKGIEKLPEKLKTPLIMRDIDGLSYKEIADALNCEVGTIKSRIFRARESLKIILEPFQNELLA